MIADSAPRWPPTLRPSQLTWTVIPPERSGSYRPHPPSPFIITQPESWYSFYHPTEGGRLSRPRHCSKGMCYVCQSVILGVCHALYMYVWNSSCFGDVFGLDDSSVLRHLRSSTVIWACPVAVRWTFWTRPVCSYNAVSWGQVSNISFTFLIMSYYIICYIVL